MVRNICNGGSWVLVLAVELSIYSYFWLHESTKVSVNECVCACVYMCMRVCVCVCVCVCICAYHNECLQCSRNNKRRKGETTQNCLKVVWEVSQKMFHINMKCITELHNAFSAHSKWTPYTYCTVQVHSLIPFCIHSHTHDLRKDYHEHTLPLLNCTLNLCQHCLWQLRSHHHGNRHHSTNQEITP